jgi:hypothetical protein
MRALTGTLWDARRRPADALALAVAGAYCLLAARVGLNLFAGNERYLLLLPLAVAAVLILNRSALSPAQTLGLGAAAVVGSAFYFGRQLPDDPTLAYAAPAVVVAGVLASRRPALAFAGVIFCSGAFGSLQALASVPAAKLADLFMVGLWVSVAWAWMTGPRRNVIVRPALVALGAYLVITLLEILLADSTQAAVQSFRGQSWYLGAVLLLTYAPWPPDTRRRMVHAATLVGTLIGAYATLRWAIGPAAAERTLAGQNLNNYLDGELRPVGSFSSAKELAAWTATVSPFLLGIGLTERGRWRLIGFAGAALCVIGMLAANVRSGPAAAVPGAMIVVGLYQASQAFRGRRGPLVLVLVMASAVGAAGAFALTLGGKSDTSERYTNILHPARDESYQARLVKWRTALDDIQHASLGHGLGTSGRSQKRFGTTTNIGSDDIDNSYLKVAFEQGFVIMALLAGSLVLILVTLAKGGALATDPARAGPAIAACGALVAMLVLFWVGNYIEGLTALGGWLLVGIGMGQLTYRDSTPEPS